MDKKKLGFLTAVAALLLLGLTGPAHARPSGKIRPAMGTALQPRALFVPANVSYTITTSSLLPATAGYVPDTVVHVQNVDADGSFAFGDDDSGAEFRSSRVVIPAVSFDRNFVVIVRAYSDYSAGTCNLTYSGSNGSNFTVSVRFGGRRYEPGAFDTQTHFWTTEEPLGSSDTILLLLSGSSTNAIAYDDDDGVGNMAWLHSEQGCAGSCAVIVGNYGADPGTFSTRLYWDGDVHFADCDTDGLGDSFEGSIGSHACTRDSDGDGLTDAQEVVGVVETSTTLPVKLPKWGADPMFKDVFIESDWQTCTSCPDPRANQFSAAAVMKTASLYPSDIRLHVDNGVINTDPATATLYGDWGGAAPVASGFDCTTLSPERRGFFHHYFSIAGGGGRGHMPGSCSFGGASGDVLAHELGHNLGIDHGGNSPSVTVNCKPNYRSFMNYAYVYRSDVGFSDNRFSSVVLNPTNLDETRGMGTTDPAVLGDLSRAPFSYKVNTSTGAVDWNRDGTFGTGVRGAVTWNWATGGCEHAWYHSDRDFKNAHGVALAWLPLSTPRLYLFVRRASDGLIEHRYATQLDSCAGKRWQDGCANWSPAVGSSARLISNAKAGAYAPAARAFAGSGGPKIMLVYTAADQKLHYQIGTPASTGGAMSFTNPVVLNSMAVASEPEILNSGPNGTLRVYAREGSSQRLRSWDYNVANNSWSSGKWELWSDGTEIKSTSGIGVTKGYFKGMTDLQVVAAFAVPVTGGNQVETARLDPANGRWVKLGGWPSGRIPSGTKPAIAYAPYKKSSSLTAGRYFLTFTWAGGTSAQIMMTEGNDLSTSATSQRYLWQGSTYLVNQWGNTMSTIPLLYDLARDNNLRAAWTFSDTKVANFFPFADGIGDLQLKDSDDRSYLRSTLACSIGKASCPPL